MTHEGTPGMTHDGTLTTYQEPAPGLPHHATPDGMPVE